KLISYVSAHGPLTIGSLLAAMPQYDRPQLWRTLGWLIKLGIVGASYT
ncbi:MAG: hypothetical protein JO253_05450, partial [Alphaproteobacteria bacterium]|nr:hypothetical protein [Alphaproteobacteria bacterium]